MVVTRKLHSFHLVFTELKEVFTIFIPLIEVCFIFIGQIQVYKIFIGEIVQSDHGGLVGCNAKCIVNTSKVSFVSMDIFFILFS